MVYEVHGRDPQTSIGAFFYLSGWGIGLDTVDQRRGKYRDKYFVDISTPWRRSEKGIRDLATIIRDHNENSRPWAVVSFFQSGNTFQPFMDFNMGFESLQRPVVFLNDVRVDVDLRFHEDPKTKLRYTSRVILPEAQLNLSVGFGEPMAKLRVLWSMPVWPVWSVMSWTADPRIMTVLRTFRERAVEVSLQWWRHLHASEVEALVTDSGIWTAKTDPNMLNLPDKWRAGP
ncbi:hypothetical protein [Paenarthrobacter nicotinovorans]|uniref:hypothetical protein n=1 Tax=Paenarthrobacter nicotinovorans TaxID=29320 RepID=UPI003D67A1AF